MAERFSPNLTVRFPDGLPVVCPTCRQTLGVAKASARQDGIHVEMSAETFDAHQFHMSTEHPTEGDH